MKFLARLPLLSPLLLLTACVVPAKYHEPSHQTVRENATGEIDGYPTVTLEVGEVRRMTTPARGTGPMGWWLSVATEDSSIARALPVDGDYTRGTKLEGVAPGRTRAVYGNAAPMHHSANADEWLTYDGKESFWIEVVEPDEE